MTELKSSSIFIDKELLDLLDDLLDRAVVEKFCRLWLKQMTSVCKSIKGVPDKSIDFTGFVRDAADKFFDVLGDELSHVEIPEEPSKLLFECTTFNLYCKDATLVLSIGLIPELKDDSLRLSEYWHTAHHFSYNSLN